MINKKRVNSLFINIIYFNFILLFDGRMSDSSVTAGHIVAASFGYAVLLAFIILLCVLGITMFVWNMYTTNKLSKE